MLSTKHLKRKHDEAEYDVPPGVISRQGGVVHSRTVSFHFDQARAILKLCSVTVHLWFSDMGVDHHVYTTSLRVESAKSFCSKSFKSFYQRARECTWSMDSLRSCSPDMCIRICQEERRKINFVGIKESKPEQLRPFAAVASESPYLIEFFLENAQAYSSEYSFRADFSFTCGHVQTISVRDFVEASIPSRSTEEMLQSECLAQRPALNDEELRHQLSHVETEQKEEEELQADSDEVESAEAFTDVEIQSVQEFTDFSINTELCDSQLANLPPLIFTGEGVLQDAEVFGTATTHTAVTSSSIMNSEHHHLTTDDIGRPLFGTKDADVMLLPVKRDAFFEAGEHEHKLKHKRRKRQCLSRRANAHVH
jgi:hypothetical protein